MVLADFGTINADATDPRAGRPDDNGGITKVPGDWHETMSTHWFHDHMFGFTARTSTRAMRPCSTSIARSTAAPRALQTPI